MSSLQCTLAYMEYPSLALDLALNVIHQPSLNSMLWMRKYQFRVGKAIAETCSFAEAIHYLRRFIIMFALQPPSSPGPPRYKTQIPNDTNLSTTHNTLSAPLPPRLVRHKQPPPSLADQYL